MGLHATMYDFHKAINLNKGLDKDSWDARKQGPYLLQLHPWPPEASNSMNWCACAVIRLWCRRAVFSLGAAACAHNRENTDRATRACTARGLVTDVVTNYV